MRRIGASLFFLILQLNLQSFAQPQYSCDDRNGNYTRNSTYSNNLDTALSSIPANISANGFYNGSSGSRNPDIAYAISLCRADVQPQSCRDCIQGLTTGLRTACPNQRQAVEWDEFCMLRYSDVTIFGILATSPGVSMWNLNNATSPADFMADVRGLCQNLTVQAAAGGSLRKIAARNITGPDSQIIYAMMQCTPDLSSDECSSCLTEAAADLPRCCNGSIGARVLRPSCDLRYETRPFYNETRLQELGAVPAPRPPLAPGTPSSSPPEDDGFLREEAAAIDLKRRRKTRTRFVTRSLEKIKVNFEVA